MQDDDLKVVLDQTAPSSTLIRMQYTLHEERERVDMTKVQLPPLQSAHYQIATAVPPWYHLLPVATVLHTYNL